MTEYWHLYCENILESTRSYFIQITTTHLNIGLAGFYTTLAINHFNTTGINVLGQI